MALNINPTGIFTNYEYSPNGTTNLTSVKEGFYIPVDDIDLPNGNTFNTNEANEALATADHRKLLWGVLDAYFTSIDAQVDKPAKMTISRSNFQAIAGDKLRRSYTVNFDFDIGDFEVDAEV